MTFIVVPHGGRDLSTRSFEISYRRLRIVGGLMAVGVVVWLGMLLSWLWVASQAARVPGLQHEVRALEQERARVVQLADALRRLEGQYEQVRQMLGADQSSGADNVYLPPVDSVAAVESR
jgi:uncharacterized protein YjeT (DUF2065 family)